MVRKAAAKPRTRLKGWKKGNQVCVRCHVVDGERWDNFFRFPPCGTVAEIKATSDLFGKVQSKGG